MRLEGDMVRILCDMITDSFTADELSQLLVFKGRKTLEAYVPGHADIKTQAFKLVELSRREGWLDDFVAYLQEARPLRSDWKEFLSDVGVTPTAEKLASSRRTAIAAAGVFGSLVTLAACAAWYYSTAKPGYEARVNEVEGQVSDCQKQLNKARIKFFDIELLAQALKDGSRPPGGVEPDDLVMVGGYATYGNLTETPPRMVISSKPDPKAPGAQVTVWLRWRQEGIVSNSFVSCLGRIAKNDDMWGVSDSVVGHEKPVKPLP
jgi:hypothetical protein